MSYVANTQAEMQEVFSSNLRYFRKSAQLSQWGLSCILDINRENIQQYETRRAMPGYRVMTAISRYFSLTVDEMITVHQDPKKKEVAA